MAMVPGVTDTIEYLSPYGNKVSAKLEKTSLRLAGLAPNASDPDWWVSVDGQRATKVETIFYVAFDGTPWDCKVHAHRGKPPYVSDITFDMDFIAKDGGTHSDTVLAFQDWDKKQWRAWIPTLPNAEGQGDVQPMFKLEAM